MNSIIKSFLLCLCSFAVVGAFAPPTTSSVLSSSSSALPYAHAALQVVGKHGLQIMAVSGAASLVPPIITTIRGGGGSSTSTIQVKKQQQAATVQKKKSFKLELTPQGKSVAWMALGMVRNQTTTKKE